MKNSNQMQNTIQLYYFAYLFQEKSFVSLILNVEEIGRDYKVINIEGEPPNPAYLAKVLGRNPHTKSTTKPSVR